MIFVYFTTGLLFFQRPTTMLLALEKDKVQLTTDWTASNFTCLGRFKTCAGDFEATILCSRISLLLGHDMQS